MPFLMTSDVYDAMIAHGSKGDLACCGILAGPRGEATTVYPLRNAAKSRIRYEADPSDLIKAVLDMKKRGFSMTAIYYSRRDNAAIPTPTDLRKNTYGDLPRIIVSVGESPSVRAWRLSKRYCVELDWEVRREGSEHTPRRKSSLASFLERWTRRIPIGHLQDIKPIEPNPMWDPSLDRDAKGG